jgi:mRNA interferase MazF
MKRGEIRWYEFPSPDKRRPVLLLTRESILPRLNEVTVPPITSTIRGIPSEVTMDMDDGMPQLCAVNLDHLQTVPKRNIGRLITTLSAEKLHRVGLALCFALGFDEYLKFFEDTLTST